MKRLWSKLFLTVVLCLTMLGCVDKPKELDYVAQGYVRNIWVHPGYTTIVFEHDNGDIVTFELNETIPPMWAGMHCTLSYHKYEGQVGYVIDNVKVIHDGTESQTKTMDHQ